MDLYCTASTLGEVGAAARWQDVSKVTPSPATMACSASRREFDTRVSEAEDLNCMNNSRSHVAV
jgi:hypothetical protein